MFNINKFVLSIASSVMLMGCSSTAFDGGGSRTPNPITSICQNEVVPAGYVITGWGNSSSCGPVLVGGWNSIFIKIPGIEEAVCRDSPIPSNYAVIGVYQSPNCPGWAVGVTNNVKLIRRI